MVDFITETKLSDSKPVHNHTNKRTHNINASASTHKDAHVNPIIVSLACKHGKLSASKESMLWLIHTNTSNEALRSSDRSPNGNHHKLQSLRRLFQIPYGSSPPLLLKKSGF